MACIPLEDPIVVEEPAAEDPAVVVPPANNDGSNNNYDNGGNGNDLSDYNGLPDTEEEASQGGHSCKGRKKDKDQSCGRHKVVVCHVPHGNAGNARTLCISRMGFMFGYSRHEGDHLGACDSEDLGDDD